MLTPIAEKRPELVRPYDDKAIKGIEALREAGLHGTGVLVALAAQNEVRRLLK